MKEKSRMRSIVSGALLASLALLSSHAGAQTVAFLQATVWSAQLESPLENAVLIVRDGRVVDLFAQGQGSVPPDAELVNLQGAFVIPGIINAHGHIGGSPGFNRIDRPDAGEAVKAQLDLYASYGVTSVFSMGGEPVQAFDWRRSSDTPEHATARLMLAGPALSPDGLEQVAADVSSAADLQPDYLKIRVDSRLGNTSKMPQPVYATLIEQAAQRGLPVSAHMVELQDAVSLVQAGVGLLAHSVRDEPVSQELIDLMNRSGVCLTPTLMREVSTYIYRDRPEFFGDPWFLRSAHPDLIENLLDPQTQQRYASESANWYRDQLPLAIDNMMVLHRAGATIAMGTDTGVGARFQGYFEQLEMELMQQAGMSAHDVLMSATADAARCLGRQQDIGLLQPGRWADFLVLQENPLQDVSALRSLQSVYIGGKAVQAVP